MSSDGKYVCTLDAASIKKAEKELNEIPKERESSVETLRQWVKANSSWLKSPTDTKFLLSFLRPSKFAQLAARQRLVKYWQVRTRNKDWFKNLDTHDPDMVKLWRMGCYLELPKRDKEGRFIFINRAAAFEPSKITVKEMMRSSIAGMDLALLDENLQVNGTVLLLDFTDMALKHQTFYSPDTIRRSMDAWLLHFHGKNLGDVYKHIDQSCLPRDYLPDDYSGKCIGSIQDIIEQQIKRLQEPETRDYILRLSSSGYGVDELKKPSDDELFTESFRKLNIE